MTTRPRKSPRPALTDVVSEIYEAALHPEHWMKVLTQVNGFLNVRSSMLLLADAKSGINIAVNCGLDPQALAEFGAHYWQQDPGLPVFAREGPGSTALTNQIMTDSEFSKTEFADFLGRYDIFYCGGASLARSGGRDGVVAIQRPRRAGAFDAHDLGKLKAVVPHLQRAFQISRTLSGLATERDTALSMLDQLPHAVILLDAAGRAVAMNRSAEAIARRNDGISLTSAGLQVSAPDEQYRLRELLHHAGKTGLGRGTHTGGALAVSRPSGAQPYRVLIVPVRMPQPKLNLGAPRACVACIIAAPETATSLQPAHLQAWFGLTSAEARVALAVTEGQSVKEIAERAATSAETVRNQLKTVFGKFGVHRQAELVRLLLTSPTARVRESETN